jgi:hypothetical protein
MLEKRYADCFHDFEHPPVTHDRKIKIGLPLTYTRRTDPNANFHFEIFTFTQPSALSAGRKWALSGTTGNAGSVVEDTPHYHIYDEYFLIMGTNQDNNLELGGEIEQWLGLGKDAEQYLITKPCVMHVPAGLVHGPTVFRRVDSPINYVVIAPADKFYSYHIDVLPPAFKLPPGI